MKAGLYLDRNGYFVFTDSGKGLYSNYEGGIIEVQTEDMNKKEALFIDYEKLGLAMRSLYDDLTNKEK